MKIPLSLIHSYIKLNLPAEKIGETLTLLGIEVDQIKDGVFELSLTPNLGHCMSALGIARELSAALQIPLHRKVESLPHSKLDIEIELCDLAPRYLCRLVEVEAGTPVVDITNDILLKTGQPLHAYDADLLEGKILRVAPAKTSFPFLCLDGVEREVPAGTLVIYDAEKPVAVAGIMGGANTAISEKTKRVLIEAACFDPIAIRNASKKMALRSESSQRFEKGIDPSGLELALAEACHLMKGKIGGGAEAARGTFKPKVLSYRPHRINQLLGTKLSATEIEEIFQRLGFKAKDQKVEIPLYRNDVQEEIDLVEEVARIYGYNHIEKRATAHTNSRVPSDPVFVFEQEMRRRLSGLGLFEFLTCDLISPKLAEISREITPPSLEFLKTTYSKSEEYSVLRTSLLPGLLQVVKGNLDQKNDSLAAFEIGRIHFLQKGSVVEIPMGAILLTGKNSRSNWSRKAVDVDFFDLKGIVEPLISDSAFVPSEHLSFHPGRQADIKWGEQIIGSLGEVHPSLLEKFGIDQRVYYAELNLLNLMHTKKGHFKVAPLPQFPASQRDATFPLPLSTPIATLFTSIRELHLPLLEQVELIDLYTPEHLSQKNATFRFTYRDLLKTISFEEVEKAHAKVLDAVTNLLAK